jgi:hypothetical protein
MELMAKIYVKKNWLPRGTVKEERKEKEEEVNIKKGGKEKRHLISMK